MTFRAGPSTAVAVALLLATTVLAACATAPVTPPAPSVTQPPAPSATPSATPAPTERLLPSPSASGAVTTVTWDDALLGILPPDIDGIAVAPEAQAFLEASADPDFATNVEDAAFFVAAGATDLVSGLVAHLRPGVYSDDFFRDWRDSYDDGACGQAGGVAGNAQAELGGRPVHITSCVGGLRVYHAYLAERDTIVSALSVGEQRFGEQLMGGLTP